MRNPLTYPSKNETLKDQERVVPTYATMRKVERRRRYMGNIELENMIMDNLSKFGLLVSSNTNQTENPSLVREAYRPSLISQHINFQSKKIWLRNKQAKQAEKN